MMLHEKAQVIRKLEVLHRTMEYVRDHHPDQFKITSYQTAFGAYRRRLSTMHGCGNTACVAGFGAMTEEFRADGGSMDVTGRPTFGSGVKKVSGFWAIMKWLGLPLDTDRGNWPMPPEEKVSILMSALMSGSAGNWNRTWAQVLPFLAPDLVGPGPQSVTTLWIDLEASDAVKVIHRCIQIMKGEVQ